MRPIDQQAGYTGGGGEHGKEILTGALCRDLALPTDAIGGRQSGNQPDQRIFALIKRGALPFAATVILTNQPPIGRREQGKVVAADHLGNAIGALPADGYLCGQGRGQRVGTPYGQLNRVEALGEGERLAGQVK